MLSREDNERLTRVGPGTPAGKTLRRYWLPALLSSEVPEPDGVPMKVRLLGEDFVAFRDTSNAVGLVDAYCPHRRAPMFLGRNEKSGLRCIYHGWKFDRSGQCLEMPTEPRDSAMKAKMRIDAYPTWEGGGIVWAYLGPAAEKPAPPVWEFIRAPQTHRFVSRTVQDCNYLQALEGGLDSAHAQILHNIDIGDLSWLNDYERTTPKLEVFPTDYGFRYTGIRAAGNRYWVRAYHYIMPVTQVRARIAPVRGKTPRVPAICGHYWVPMDDTTTMVFNFLYSADPEIPVTKEFAMESERDDGRGPEDIGPDRRNRQNRQNDYMIDRGLQKTRTFTGIRGVNTQDVAVQEGMGDIVDRTKEHLGSTDRAIIAMRRQLLEATRVVEAGGSPLGVDPTSYAQVRGVDHYANDESEIASVIANEIVARF